MNTKINSALTVILIDVFLFAVTFFVLINTVDSQVDEAAFDALVVFHCLAYFNALAIVVAAFFSTTQRLIIPLLIAGFICFFGSILGLLVLMGIGFSHVR